MSRKLPDPFWRILEQRLDGAPLAELRAGYAALGREYRGRSMGEAVPGIAAAASSATRAPASASDLGYLAARFPATYSAVAAAAARIPDLALHACASVLDVGAGPGTAVWALHQRFPGIKNARLFDRNEGMLAHAEAFAAAAPGLEVTLERGDALELLTQAPSADLVVMAYALGEFEESRRAELLARAWEKCAQGVLLVEPGTPEGFRAVLAAREVWTAQGGRVVAPCPQQGPCPMAGGESWCHFSQRLERRGQHRGVKGGQLGYEDEKFSWLFVSKDPDARPAAPYRLHAFPRRVNRNIALDVCDFEGARRTYFYRRRETPFGIRMAARRLAWGDGWDPAVVRTDVDGETPEDPTDPGD